MILFFFLPSIRHLPTNLSYTSYINLIRTLLRFVLSFRGALDGRKAVIVLTICTLDRCSGVVLDRDRELCSFWPRSMDVLTSFLWVLRKRWQNWPNQSNKSDLQSNTFRGREEDKMRKEIFNHCSLRKNYRSSMALASSIGMGRRLSTSGAT